MTQGIGYSWHKTLAVTWMLIAALTPITSRAQSPEQNTALIKQEMAFHWGVSAYIYGYPMVDMLKQMHNDTHWVSAAQTTYAPLNQFYRFRQLVTPDTAGTLRAPNNDTLYFAGWFDLSKQPMVIHNPDTEGRYFTMAVTNLYAEVMHLGRRTIGTSEQYHALVGPHWKGTLPDKVVPLHVDSDRVWILGRLLVDGKQDLPAALKLLDKFWANPLSEWRRGKPPAVAMPAQTKPVDPMNSLEYFAWLNAALKANTQRDSEEALMDQFNQIGVGPFSTFNAETLDPDTRAGLERAIPAAQALIQAASRRSLPAVNGWMTSLKIGRYGYDYLHRAAVAKGGYGNLPEETIYSAALFDDRQTVLTGSKRYQIRFEKHATPPVNGFWSLSVYRQKDAGLEKNAIERYSIGDRTRDLSYDQNGSLNIYLQATEPMQGKSNWLPTPTGDFYIIMRMYEPQKTLLQGEYQLPPVMLVE
jgi:hypothetical protein